MSSVAHKIIFALLVFCTVVWVTQVAGATAMSLTMALADSGAIDMPDCDGCDPGADDDKSGIGCEFVCTAPLLAGLGQENTLEVPPTVLVTVPGISTRNGRTGPPDPYPPRSLI